MTSDALNMTHVSDKIVVASGYFDPLHVGHIEYLERAKSIGRILIVIVNNNEQAIQKKGKPFMDEFDRLKIVKSLKSVDIVHLSIDKDLSVCKTIEMLCSMCKIDIFAKGGDRLRGNIPETDTCLHYGIEVVDGLGGKTRSSSEYTKGNYYGH